MEITDGTEENRGCCDQTAQWTQAKDMFGRVFPLKKKDGIFCYLVFYSHVTI